MSSQQLVGSVVVFDPLIASQVAQVLQAPAAIQRPDLMHFAPPQNLPPRTVSAPALPEPRQPTGTSPVLTGIIAGTLLGWLLLLVLGRRRRPARRRYLTAVGAYVLVVLFASAVLLAPPSGQTGPGTRATLLSSQTAPADNPQRDLLNDRRDTKLKSAEPWQQLVSIEQTINGQQGALLATAHQVALESAVLVSALKQTTDRDEAAARLIADIQSALRLHQAVATGFQTSLENEYDFFVNAVQTPAAVSQIRAAAAVSGGSAMRAVAYDLETVQTQVAQEAAIAAAAAAAQAAAAQEPALTGPVHFRAPVGGVVTQGFGPTDFGIEPPATYRGVFYPHFHTGLDIAASRGTQVGAAAAGVVVLAASSVDASGHLVGYGNYVIVRHAGGFLTLYGHLDQLLAYPGEVVKRGQVIGLLGSTGWSTGPHLHFEVRKGDTPMDPGAYIASDLRAP